MKTNEHPRVRLTRPQQRTIAMNLELSMERVALPKSYQRELVMEMADLIAETSESKAFKSYFNLT